MKKNYLLPLIFSCFVYWAKAQNLLGIANSNYAGTNGLYLNPASIADSKYRFFMNFFTFDFYIANNYFQSGQKLSVLLKNYEDFKVVKMIERSNGNFFGLGFDIRPFNFLVRINEKNSFALGVRPRLLINATDVSQNIYTLARFEGNSFADAYRFYPFKSARGNLNINALAEYRGTYARTLWSEGNHYLKAGATLKYLQGFGGLTIQGKNVDFFIDDDDYYNMEQGEITIGYSDPRFADFNSPQDAFRGKLANGFGADLGVSYEFRPNPNENKYQMDGETRTDHRMITYKYRIGLSLIDIGRITYKLQDSRFYTINRNTLTIVKRFDVSQPDSLAKDLGANLNQITAPYKTTLPTMLFTTFDYKLANKLYANLTYGQSLRRKSAIGMHQASFVSITPRYESRLLEFALPMMLSENFSNFNVGLSMRLAYLFIGSDNIIGTLFSETASGANIYTGLNLPIFNKKRPKDSDGDGISDKKDKCPNTAGTVGGCPDRDNDGIADADDACPDEAGLVEFQGCADRDGDKIIDKNDLCPDQPGLREFQGCPDTDGDGIADKDDACPNEAGLAQFQGCPDKDGDGIPDKDDACPNEAGLAQFQGCPDKDGDGVPDKDDACPDVPGLKDNKGCPANKIEEDKLAAIASEIQFETGKATIKRQSFPMLDELAQLMLKYNEAKIQVEGHTDNVGNKQANKQLSQRRANAIKNYLVKKGVPPSRIIAIGFGDERPKDGSKDIKAANRTPEQRAANRRVEIKSL